MTTAVILDGPGAGMTERDFDQMRADDCIIAKHLGWKPLDDKGQLWVDLCDPPESDGRWRDEAIPFFHLDADAAVDLLKFALTCWRYAAKQIFFCQLQKQAAQAETIEWPDVLIPLSADLPKYVSQAFLGSITWFHDHLFNPYEASAPSVEYSDGVKFEKVKVMHVDADGTEREVEKLKAVAPPGKAPWVH